MSSISGGIIWSVTATAAIAAERAAAILEQAGQQNITLGLANAQETGKAYRPTEWSNQPLTSITLTTKSSVSTAQTDNLTSGPTGTIGSGQTTNQSASSTTPSTTSDVYVFDAVIRIDHSQQIRTTDHPVQSGASISDHALILPAKVVMEIGMSDAMDAYAPGVWTSNPSKSVSAYQTLVALQQGRQPLTVTTRLATYTNMLIELIQAPDTKETRTGLKATITFKQIFNGTVTLTPVSDRPQTTDTTSIGAKQAMPISSSDLKRFTTLLPTTVPGAGNVIKRDRWWIVMQLIPLDNSPNQTFTCSLSVDGSTLTLKFAVNYNSMAGHWLMTIWDASGKLLLSSIPLLTGAWPAANILSQFGYLRIGSAFLISNGSLADFPDATNLGSEFQLWWGDTQP